MNRSIRRALGVVSAGRRRRRPRRHPRPAAPSAAPVQDFLADQLAP